MRNEAVHNNPYTLRHVPARSMTQGMCNKAVYYYPWVLGDVPDHFKNREMCNEAVGLCLCLLRHVPDWFVTREWVHMWHNDSKYRDDDKLIKWYGGHKKRKAQKAKIKEELIPIAWHPSRWWDWCVPEDEKKETENFFLTI